MNEDEVRYWRECRTLGGGFVLIGIVATSVGVGSISGLGWGVFTFGILCLMLGCILASDGPLYEDEEADERGE